MWSRLVDATAPPERLAAFRVCVGVFTVAYLSLRFPVFWGLADKAPSTFAGVGPLAWVDDPLPAAVIRGALVVGLVSGIATTIGYRFRVAAPTLAVVVLLLTTYRSSWGQLLHFENLVVLHLLIVAIFPGADAWSLDARRTGGRRRDPTTYGLALQLACLCVVTTYLIAGIAKLRLGGFEWAFGDTLRNHIAYSAVRLDLLGATGSPIAGMVVRNAWMLPPMAALSVLIELAAPVALVGSRLRNLWIAAAWSMHVAIFATMLVGFPYPLFLVAFTPFFALERVVPRWPVHGQMSDGHESADAACPDSHAEGVLTQRQSAQRPYTSMMCPVATNPASAAISPNDASSVCSKRGARVTSWTRPHSLQIR